MKFGAVETRAAEGCMLAHATRLPDKTLKKGHVLSQSDCDALAEIGLERIVVARPESGDLNENAAASRLATAAINQGLIADTAFTRAVEPICCQRRSPSHRRGCHQRSQSRRPVHNICDTGKL